MRIRELKIGWEYFSKYEFTTNLLYTIYSMDHVSSPFPLHSEYILSIITKSYLWWMFLSIAKWISNVRKRSNKNFICLIENIRILKLNCFMSDISLLSHVAWICAPQCMAQTEAKVKKKKQKKSSEKEGKQMDNVALECDESVRWKSEDFKEKKKMFWLVQFQALLVAKSRNPPCWL